jgi:hypothetical protein
MTAIMVLMALSLRTWHARRVALSVGHSADG